MRIRTSGPLRFASSYAVKRTMGSFILIDEATNETWVRG